MLRPDALRRAWLEFHADADSQLGVARLILGWPALYLVLGAACDWAGWGAPLPLRAGLAALLYAALSRAWPSGGARVSRRCLALSGGFLIVAFAVCACFYDTSWDGEKYHLPATLALAQGWNPIRGVSDIPMANWNANGIWTVRAALYALLGSVEASKGVNAALMLAGLFTTVPALMALLGRPLKAGELCGAYLAAANPVAAGQLLTFYIDGPLYEAGLVALAATLLAGTRHRRQALFLLPAAILLMTGAKLTAAYFAPTLVAAAGLASCAVWRPTRAALAPAGLALAAFLAGVLAIGYRPYVTNPLEFGTLTHFPPLRSVERPMELLGRLPPTMLAASLVSRTTERDEAMRLKPPFMVSPAELRNMGAPDPRTGGFGPVFALELLLALAAVPFAPRAAPGEGRETRRLAYILAAALAAIAAAFPEPWWARFVPFFWLVPLFLLLGAAARGVGRRFGHLATAVLILALANGSLALFGNAARTALGDWRTRHLMSDLAARHAEIVVTSVPYDNFQNTMAYRLARRGVPFRLGAARDCAKVIAVDRIALCLAKPAE